MRAHRHSTSLLVAAANASLSLFSTVGPQSLAIGKPHAYLSTTGRDIFTAMGLIPVASTVPSLVRALNVSFRREGFAVGEDAMRVAGVPLNGTANQEARLHELLRRNPRLVSKSSPPGDR